MLQDKFNLFMISTATKSVLLIQLACRELHEIAPDQGDQEVAPQQDQGHGGAGQAAVDR